MKALRRATYSSSVFDVQTVEQAKAIILTPQAGMTPDQRWRTETPYLLTLIGQSTNITEDSVILDYGCGIGRMSKALIEEYGCRVIGADISPSMRALAASYVSSDRFLVCAPEALDWLSVEFDTVLAIWVLQHCQHLRPDVERIYQRMKPSGELFILNDKRRIVPTLEAGWVNDGQDVQKVLREFFSQKEVGTLDPKIMGENVVETSYWAVFSDRLGKHALKRK